MKILLSGFCLLSFLSLSAQDSLTILFAGDAMMHQKQLDNTRRGDFFDLGSIIRKTKNQDFKNEKSKKTANDLLIAFIV